MKYWKEKACQRRLLQGVTRQKAKEKGPEKRRGKQKRQGEKWPKEFGERARCLKRYLRKTFMSCQIKSFPHSPYDIINKILSCKRITADHCSQFPNARIFFPFKNQPGAIHPSIISQRESSFCYSASHHSTVQRNLCKTAKIPLRIRNRGDVR